MERCSLLPLVCKRLYLIKDLFHTLSGEIFLVASCVQEAVLNQRLVYHALLLCNVSGCGVLCASESSDSDVVWSMSCDQFPYHTALAESQAVLAVDGVIWAIADVTPPSLWGDRGQAKNQAVSSDFFF